MDRAVVRKIKLNGAVMTFPAYVVEDDEHGLWLFTSPGSLVHTAKAHDVTYKAMGNGTEPGFLWLMPRDEWWFGAWWTRPDGWGRTNIDACTPPTLTDGVWTWTDLELDVCRDLSGRVWVEDEDEFDDSIALGLIDDDAQKSARAVTDEMVRRLTERVAPFDDSGWKRHDDVVALGLSTLNLD